VLGSWLVQGEPAGLGVREGDGPITDDASRFIPHLIDG
jgi:glutathionylspermidine synthase